MTPTDVLHNARVIRPAGHAPLEGDAPSLDASVERCLVHLENVPTDDALKLHQDVRWQTIGPAASGAGNAALCEMSLALARKLTTDPAGAVALPVLAAARAVVSFNETRFELRARDHTLRMGPRSLIMGIINVTPDSFSDGGSFFETDVAIEHGRKLAQDGADILDVGGCSTRPGSQAVPTKEELRRVLPVVDSLADELDVPISIDSIQPEVVRRALEAGASIVNDVTGLHLNPELAELAAEFEAALVVMHIQGTPQTMQKDPSYRDLMSEVCRYLRESLELARRAGLTDGQLVIDPGFGFGKSLEHNLELLRRLSELRSLGVPIMVGTSRKSTIGKVLDLPVTERLWGTAATVAVARAAGALLFRMHDVAEMDQVRRMSDAVFGR